MLNSFRPQHEFEEVSAYKPPRSLRSMIFGRPIATWEGARQQPVGIAVGLAVFGSDVLASSAYAIDEILKTLILAGAGALSASFPIAVVITGFLIILTISYRQIIDAYPRGGSAYIVARENLGQLWAQFAGAGLLIDYILTLAVSISAGVAQIASAFPHLHPWRVQIAVGVIVLMTVINLRGAKGSGFAFAVPLYFFLGMILLTVGVGLFRYWSGALSLVGNISGSASTNRVTQTLTFLLILRAFAGGATALTGAEAISNGVTSFKRDESRNARITLAWMSVILGVNLLGLTFLARQAGAIPSPLETGFSQIGRAVFGGESFLYFALIGSTTLILVLAANTSANASYADFPRLAALHASDGFLPRQLTFRGSRMVYSNGIITLASAAAILVIMFRAETSALIPLYAIGVFLSFTLSQAGMTVRWWRCRHLKPGDEIIQIDSRLIYSANWLLKMVINGTGALTASVIMLVFAITKFAEGAWLVLILIPAFVAVFYSIRAHYAYLAVKLSLHASGYPPPHITRHRVIMPVSGVHQGTLNALRYARMLSDDVTCLHIVIEPGDAEKTRRKWETWGEGVRLVMLDSPYRLFIEPLLEYIADIAENRQPGEIITVVVPEFVSENRWTSALHTNTADLLRSQLKNQHGIVITNVPYHVQEYEGDHVSH